MPKDRRPYYATRAELRAIDEGLAETPRSIALARAEARIVGKRAAGKADAPKGAFPLG